MRVMIAAGGTGGHVYPALATAEAVKALRPDAQLYFVGSVGGFERPLLDEADIRFERYDEVRAGPLHGVNPLRALVSMGNLVLGTWQALRLTGAVRPHVLLLTGGWVGLPIALACWLRRVPSLIYLPDIEPGLTIKMLRRLATRVAATTPDSAIYFAPGQTVATGYPLRAAVVAAVEPEGRARAIAHFGLDPLRRTLLVFGGSRGARTINMALVAILPELVADGLQILHISGTLDWPTIEAARDDLRRTHPNEGARYHAFAYLHDDMALAFAAADLVVCRAGASTLGELPLFGLPSILVPYPFAWRYQKVNAEYLAGREAAILMEDDKMASELLPTIRALLNDPARLAAMGTAARALARPDGATNVARELLRLAGDKA